MKIKPIARIEKRRDDDGWHEWDEINYYCPKCKKQLRGYGKETGCAECELFFDWGNKEPKIEITKRVKWE